MKFFDLHLQSTTQFEVVKNVASFMGEDASGSFGILGNHARMMTCLKYGLSWFHHADGTVEYLALPGAVLYFVNNVLFINTHHYLRSLDYRAMTAALDHELRQEEENLHSLRESLRRLDEEMLKHLLELKRQYRYETK